MRLAAETWKVQHTKPKEFRLDVAFRVLWPIRVRVRIRDRPPQMPLTS